MKEEVTRKCSCGEQFDFEGWNVNEKIRQGNAYHIKGDKEFRIKYTKCDKCGKEVIIDKEKWLK